MTTRSRPCTWPGRPAPMSTRSRRRPSDWCREVLDKTVQAGNTSLMMAYDILVDDDGLDQMQDVANSIASKHIMFATSKVFEDIYVNEIAYWDEGMPMEMFNKYPQGRRLQTVAAHQTAARRPSASSHRDIPIIGDRGLKMLDHVGCIPHRSASRAASAARSARRVPGKGPEGIRTGQEQVQDTGGDRALPGDRLQELRVRLSGEMLQFQQTQGREEG